MKPSPCLQPKEVRCKDGVVRKVPCGHCSACLVNKGLSRANRIDDYIKDYPYQWFITLTFQDKYLPLARLSDNSFISDFDCDYNGEVYSYSIDDVVDSDKAYILKCFDNYGGIPILSHRHLIAFKKRLRYYVTKLQLDNHELFISSCGEYGPTADIHRPHYHLYVGSKSPIPTSVFEKCVHQAWSVRYKTKERSVREEFGYVTVERVFKRGCANYVAKYLACFIDLPKILSLGRWKPFLSGSTRSSELLSRLSQINVREVFNNPTFEVTVNRNGTNRVEPVPAVYFSKYFPKINRFDAFGRYELYRLYGIFQRFPCSSTAFEDCLIYIQNRGRSFKLDIDISDISFKMSGIESSGLDLLSRSVYYSCFVDYKGSFISDQFIQKRNFMRLWYISRRICRYCYELDISVSMYVDKILEFYKRLSLKKLKSFYEFQNELMYDAIHPASLGQIYTLYYNTDKDIKSLDYYKNLFGYNNENIDLIPVQKSYRDMSDKILKDSTKTKKNNDDIYSRGLKKKPFIYKLSRSINNFKSI